MLDIASNNPLFDVIIIGAGASGVACTFFTSQSNKKILVLEHNDKPLKKVFISGGGRCNWTNLQASSKDYLCGDTNFCDSVLRQFSPNDMLQLLKKHQIKISEKSCGQLFCEEGSQKIIDMFIGGVSKSQFLYNIAIQDIKKEKEFLLSTNKGVFRAKSLVVATGGLSYGNLGASDFGYKLASFFGHKIVPCAPALVPLNLSGFGDLQGLSLPAKLKCGDFEVSDSILFTHFGLSGPAILQTSLYWQSGKEIVINLLPEVDIYPVLLESKNNTKGKKIGSILKNYLPNRLVDFLLKDKDIFIAEAGNKFLQALANRINNFVVVPSGTQGYKLAEVTRGGINLFEINPQTMESKIVSGLFFIGEVLDVTGLVGGFNLQWAWSSAYVAAKNISKL